MTRTTATLDITRPAPGLLRIPLLREIVIWNRAFREYQRLNRLDAAALRDMGLSEADRRSVTIASIAARLRG